MQTWRGKTKGNATSQTEKCGQCGHLHHAGPSPPPGQWVKREKKVREFYRSMEKSKSFETLVIISYIYLCVCVFIVRVTVKSWGMILYVRVNGWLPLCPIIFSGNVVWWRVSVLCHIHMFSLWRSNFFIHNILSWSVLCWSAVLCFLLSATADGRASPGGSF